MHNFVPLLHSISVNSRRVFINFSVRQYPLRISQKPIAVAILGSMLEHLEKAIRIPHLPSRTCRLGQARRQIFFCRRCTLPRPCGSERCLQQRALRCPCILTIPEHLTEIIIFEFLFTCMRWSPFCQSQHILPKHVSRYLNFFNTSFS